MSRSQLPAEFFAEDTYTIAPQRPNQKTVVGDTRWLPVAREGQLSVDVYESSIDVIIIAPIAGVRPEDLEVFVSADLVTIRGERCLDPSLHTENPLLAECYWGRFSRSIILPHFIAADGATAILRNGVLTITLPIAETHRSVPIDERS